MTRLLNRVLLSKAALLRGMVLLFVGSPAMAADLVIESGTRTTLSTESLLARPDVATIRIPTDTTYHRPMTYRAVPLRALPGMQAMAADTELQITASDGFVTNLPAALVRQQGGAVPWLAIEPREKAWPLTADRKDIGPFYLVWTDPAASSVMSEQWPYQIETICVVPSRDARWPQLAVEPALPANSPVRRGQSVLVTQCMVCHRVSGAGDATVGPDLDSPHNPTEYFQPWALKAYIRDPRSIRSWPAMKMPGFDKTAISDPDLDALIAYLGYLSSKRQAGTLHE
jgi:mono/diheme cytochrome c family protein